MNYGYLSGNGEALELSPEDEPDRNLIALYHHIADTSELRGKRVLEVGCGRGGGSSYVTRYMQPLKMVSIDISENAVEFCRNRHPLDGLEFKKGDAESLPFEDSCFDVVLNVESSHCYGSIRTFFGEVYRVLKPRGSFLYADFRPTKDVNVVSSRLAEAGFVIRETEDITPNVLAALEQDSATKQKWISALAKNHIQQTLQIFAATSGTKLYKEFQKNALCYFRFRTEKP